MELKAKTFADIYQYGNSEDADSDFQSHCPVCLLPIRDKGDTGEDCWYPTTDCYIFPLEGTEYPGPVHITCAEAASLPTC